MGNVNQVTPEGTLRYDQTGSYKWNDPYTGRSYTIPRFTATQQYTPQGQAIVNNQLAGKLNLAQLLRQQTGFLKNYLSRPIDINKSLGKFDLNNEEVEGRLFDLGRRRLDPMFAERQSALDQKLANQGIAIGSKAYDTASRQFGEGRNDAYNQLLLSGRGQAANEALSERQQLVNELLTGRNQPINEITALLSGSQIQAPNYVNANMPSIPTTDVGGLIQQNFDNKMGIYNSKVAQSNNIMGGLFSLGGSLLGLSDRRAKKDISEVGRLGKHKLFAYRYKTESADTPKHVGFMAQEVSKKDPDAVIDAGGMKLVDYGKILLETA